MSGSWPDVGLAPSGAEATGGEGQDARGVRSLCREAWGRCVESRGAHGEWARLHATPRRSLFTPCRVARGPAHPDCLRTRRVTECVDFEGNKFRIDDDWREPGRAHKVLDLPWTGLTTLRTRDLVWAEEEVESRDRTVPRRLGAHVVKGICLRTARSL